MKVTRDDLSSIVKEAVLKKAELLNVISQDIWKHPELKYEEIYAHELLTKFLINEGFSVESHYFLPTAFRAEYSSSSYKNASGPTVAVICEYDALPKIGHACGHNLIAEAGLGAAIGIKAMLERQTEISGKVVVLGTPAEEGGGGKIALIKSGAFDDVDVALMVHPAPEDHMYAPFIAIKRATVTYTGKEAHASGYPWEGINALDAAVACYNNIAFLRHHIKPSCRIHGIISKGGDAPNVIPGETELQFHFRAASTRDLEDLRKRFEGCAFGAATATGCEVSLEYDTGSFYDSLIINQTLADLYKKHAEKLGIAFQDGNPRIIPFMASTDMGNVSRVVPSIHPTYSIGTNAANHSVAFTKASGAEKAQLPTLIAAQAMALIGLDLFCEPKLVTEAKAQLQRDLVADVE